jgi:integrase
LLFLLYSGCRIGEALALTWEYVVADMAYIATSKTDEPRTVRLRADLAAKLNARRKPVGRVWRWHQGGRLKGLLLDAKLLACGLRPVVRPKRGERRSVPPHRLSWVTFHTFCHTWATWMRRYGRADLQGLVATGGWRDGRSAARYAHVVAAEEWERVEQLPTIRGGEIAERARKKG